MTASSPIMSIFFYPNGYTACNDSKSNQIRNESEPWFLTVCREKFSRGVIGDNTSISVPTAYSGPFASLRVQYNLVPFAVTLGPDGGVYFLSFRSNGETEALDMGGNRIEAECTSWIAVVLKDKLARGVVGPRTVVRLPGAFFGTVEEALVKFAN